MSPPCERFHRGDDELDAGFVFEILASFCVDLAAASPPDDTRLIDDTAGQRRKIEGEGGDASKTKAAAHRKARRSRGSARDAAATGKPGSCAIVSCRRSALPE